LKFPSPKPSAPLALDHLKKDRRTSHHRPGEDLQQIAVLVVIDQNALLGYLFDILVNRPTRSSALS